MAGLDLGGRVAVVTGGGGGIGRAVALALAGHGADVMIGDIVPERCEEAAAAVRSLGRQAIGVPFDALDSDDVRRLVAAADAAYGRVDILVNNVGGVSRRPFLDQSERSWRKHIDLNLVSMLAATQAAAKLMIRGGQGGAILNVSTIEAERAAPGFAVYAACKAGMVSFTKSMAVELAEHRIRVNAIAPDHTVTPGARGNRTGPVDPAIWRKLDPAAQDAMDRVIPLGREGIDTECGDAAVYLCSDMASYVTGVTLPVDGGTAAAFGWVRSPEGKWTLNHGLDFG
jgi:NAD(P)-dependent dehydrogenase (short-subunit alcohol dehydrogenase family)